MISQEFKAAVLNNNLLRVRIMLKDSYVVDPTFNQLDEMLFYARHHLSNLFVSFDNEYLENDETKWNNDVMNAELVQLITNFSEVRINHLKKVVSKVLATEAGKTRRRRMEQNTCASSPSRSTTASTTKKSTLSTREATRKKALRVLKNEGKNIQEIMTEVTTQGSWKITNINDMERAAQEIIKAVQDYKNNR